MVYQQHRRHLINKVKDDTCPRARFREDLLYQMKQWQKDGERLIICLDANENIYQGELGRQLTKLNGFLHEGSGGGIHRAAAWGYAFLWK